MQSKLTYLLLLFFVLFLIVNDATGAGQSANSFFGWIGQGFESFRDFLDALFAGEDADQQANAVGFAAAASQSGSL